MPQTLPLTQVRSWQEELSDLVTDPRELLELLDLPADTACLDPAILQGFPLRVPRPFLARMRRGDPKDPLLLQVLPRAEESMEVPGYGADPLDERQCNPAPGLLQKYQGRALLLPTSSCAIHCRYCFRRHFPYADNKPGRRQWGVALAHLAADPAMEEVILSGGDPLAAPDRHLAWLAGELEGIPQLRRLRLHTRLPIMIPQRVDRALCAWLASGRLTKVLVLHANHAREFDASVDAACARLRECGVLLLNQSVLLRGINDSVEALAELSTRLLQAGVLPYYLHLPDATAGTAHFDVALDRARGLMDALQARLPGYLLPRLVREEAGLPGKTPMWPEPGRAADFAGF